MSSTRTALRSEYPRKLLVACALLLGAADSAFGDGTAFFSSEQVSQGRWEYSQKCAVCHGAQLEGGGAPALKGRIFNSQWNGHSLQDFYNYIHQNMPLGQGGALNSQEYADIVAYILAQNGLPAGNERLTPKSPMDRALDLVAATAAPAAAATAASGQIKIGELYGPLLQPSTRRPTQAELDAADTDTSSWLMYNKGYRGQRYSLLKTINAGNAAKLRPVCMFQLGELGTFSTGPVVYDGILYATTHLGTYAIDATTCKKLWSHQHIAQGPEMNATNKGVAIAGGRVIRGTQDGFLYALDAKTGAPLWVRQVADWSIGEGIGAAPIVWNDIVYIGKAGGDWGIRLDSDGRRDGCEHVGKGRLCAARWRRRVGDLCPRSRHRHAVRAGRQSRTRLPQGHASRCESVHDLHRCARRPHGQAQVVVPATTQRRSRLGCDRRVALRRCWQEARGDRGQGGHPPRRQSRRRQARVQAADDHGTEPRRAGHRRRRACMSGRWRAVEWAGLQPVDGPALCQRDRLVHGVQTRSG